MKFRVDSATMTRGKFETKEEAIRFADSFKIFTTIWEQREDGYWYLVTDRKKN